MKRGPVQWRQVSGPLFLRGPVAVEWAHGVPGSAAAYSCGDRTGLQHPGNLARVHPSA